MEPNKKYPSVIQQIELNEATFAKSPSKDSTVTDLTCVNFFFGNNGTGKSTIAQAILNDHGITYNPGHIRSDYYLHIYDEDYIKDNIQSYPGMPGLFTMDYVNISMQQEVENKQAEIKELREKQSDNEKHAEEKNKELTKLIKAFRKDIWDRTKYIRDRFSDTQTGFKNSQEKLAGRIMTSEPRDADEDELSLVYTSAFSEDAQTYELFEVPEDPYILDNMPHMELMEKSIVNTATSTFAEFLKQIGATEWVKAGHTHLSERAGDVCPYCQQKLPDDFEEKFRESFDDLYEQQLKDIDEFFHSYDFESIEITARLQQASSHYQSRYPLLDLTEYDAKYTALDAIIEKNKYNALYKLDHPNREYHIEPVGDRIKELCDYLVEFNKVIAANNEVVAAKGKKRLECTEDVFSYMAFKVKDIVQKFRKDSRDISREIDNLNNENINCNQTIKQLQIDISNLGGNKVDTTEAMHSINKILRDTGMQGFHLAPHESRDNVYKVVRDDGRIADNLSEGEKNFIAFLYFYYQVQGLQSPNDSKRSKIVVIDDPVSSMDSNSLFIVSTLVRNMIEVCRNNADNRNAIADGNYIKQIFILTHNAFFHREITYNYVKRYEYASFYLIRKRANISSVEFSCGHNPKEPSIKININPVKSSYAALWEEYKELQALNAPIPLLSVIRKIIDYYFLQLCGYDGSTIRTEVLKRENFKDASGNEDDEQFTLAKSMLSYISASRISFNDGLHYVEESADPDLCCIAFRTIFDVMGQDQHYRMMTE